MGRTVIEYYDWVKNKKEGAREQQHKMGAIHDSFLQCVKGWINCSNGKCSTKGRSGGNKGPTTITASGDRGRRNNSRMTGGQGRGYFPAKNQLEAKPKNHGSATDEKRRQRRKSK